MYMRIPGDISKITGVYEAQKNTGRVEKTGQAVLKKDVLSISDEAKDYQTVNKALRGVPDIRRNKVDEITGKVEAGNYNVTGRNVADKMVNAIFDKKA